MVRMLLVAVTLSCGGASKTDTLVASGKLVDACKATDLGYSRKLADALAQSSSATLAFTPMKPADALRAAEITIAPKDETWLGLGIELTHPAGGKVTELGVAGIEVRAEGWQILGDLGFGGAYKLLTGNVYRAPDGVSVADIGRFARDAILLKPNARAQLTTAAGTDDVTGIVAAERFAGLWTIGCQATPSTSCRIGRMFVVDPATRPTKPPAIAFTVRYAVADEAGAHCTQVEHVVVPLAAGADLSQQLAATFPAGTVSLSELRSRSRVYGAAGESSLAEDDRR